MLLILEMSLHGVRLLAPGCGRHDAALATGLKIVAMVLLAALPNAQGMFAWAHRFDRHVSVAQDSVITSTFLSIPALIVIAALLSPA